MREILFRAKQIDNDEWVEGYYTCFHETTYCFEEDYEAHPENEVHLIVTESMTDWGLPNEHFAIEVYPETVGQYTGLTDKNGRKIFEHDTLRNESYPCENDDKYDYFAMAYWSSEDAAFKICTMKKLMAPETGVIVLDVECIQDWNSNNWEIIGNIHDDHELIWIE